MCDAVQSRARFKKISAEKSSSPSFLIVNRDTHAERESGARAGPTPLSSGRRSTLSTDTSQLDVLVIISP